MAPGDEAAVRSAYDLVADSYAELVTGTDPEQQVELAMLDHFVSLLGGDRAVLDAGCGAGRLLPHLRERGCRVEGIDLSPRMASLARRDHPDFRVLVGSLTHLPYADGSFDGYVAWYSTIHLPDEALPQWLDEAVRVLRPGGLLLAAFQSGHGTREVSHAYRSVGRDITLERCNRTPARFGELFDAAGVRELARMNRAPVGSERDDQAVLIARR